MPTPPLPLTALGIDGPLLVAWTSLRAGAIRTAVNQLAAAVDRASDPGDRVFDAALAGAMLVEGWLALGDLPAATAAAEPLIRLTGTRRRQFHDPACSAELVQAQTTAHLGLGQLHEATGDHTAALHHFLTAGDLGGEDALRPWRTGAAIAMVRIGRGTEGAALAREQVSATSLTDDPHAHAVGLRTLATTAPDGHPVDVLRRAQVVAATTGDERLRAQIDTDLAAHLLLSPGQHRVGEAVGLLRRAESYAGSGGLWPLHARVGRLLGVAGEAPRPLEDETLAGLTPAERRVARLAASGLTNRQIAEKLLVTVKGVEWHLSRIYRKLGIASRATLRDLITTTAG